MQTKLATGQKVSWRCLKICFSLFFHPGTINLWTGQAFNQKIYFRFPLLKSSTLAYSFTSVLVRLLSWLATPNGTVSKCRWESFRVNGNQQSCRCLTTFEVTDRFKARHDHEYFKHTPMPSKQRTSLTYTQIGCRAGWMDGWRSRNQFKWSPLVLALRDSNHGATSGNSFRRQTEFWWHPCCELEMCFGPTTTTQRTNDRTNHHGQAILIPHVSLAMYIGV